MIRKLQNPECLKRKTASSFYEGAIIAGDRTLYKEVNNDELLLTDSQLFNELPIIYANKQFSYFIASVTKQGFEYITLYLYCIYHIYSVTHGS